MKVVFLTVEDIIEEQKSQIVLYAGGNVGILSQSLLESAVAAPRMTFGGVFLHQDIWEMAASYLFSLACNHALANANKRVAIASALMFLKLNNIEISCTTDELYLLILEVVAKTTNKQLVATFFKNHQTPNGLHTPTRPHSGTDCKTRELMLTKAWLHKNYAELFHRLALT